jgi:hypothetical protein
MRNPAELAADYIALWNERDGARRAAILAERWTVDATYIDPLARVAGRGEIAGLIGTVQAQYPVFRFAPVGSADGHGEFARFSWSFGPENGEAVAKGTDFVRRDGDCIAAVTGFLDASPAATGGAS